MRSNILLENQAIGLEIDLGSSQMSCRRPSTQVELRSPIPSIRYIDSGKPRLLRLMQSGDLRQSEAQDSLLEAHTKLRWKEDVEGFEAALEWVLPTDATYILWRWSLRNLRSHPVILDRALMLNAMNMAHASRRNSSYADPGLPRRTNHGDPIGFAHPGSPSTIALYLPGWQSWSHGGWVMAEDRFSRSRLRPLTFPMIYDKGLDPPRARGHFRTEMFAGIVDAQTDAGLAFGFLSQRQSFGYVEVHIQAEARAISVWTDLDKLQLDQDAVFHSDWACLMLGDNGMGVVDDFVALAGAMNQARIPEVAPVGWCSWYDFGRALSEGDISDTIQKASALESSIPMRIIQIDDGYQADVGDWLSTGLSFPSGMRQIAGCISGAGFTAGLWLAPFMGLAGSTTVRDHPDWILRGKWGFPANTGFVWNQFGRGFDPSHPGFLDYLEMVITTATEDWGYKYLKLDFLYAGVLPGMRHDPRATRAQSFYRALKLIRETAGDTVSLVGCGCPLGSGIGIFDSMRIGPDVAASWKPSFSPFTYLLRNEPTLPAAVNALRNTLNRAALHRRWWINDPDCLFVREEHSSLSMAEIHSLITAVGMSGGSTMLSDQLEHVSHERLELFGMLIPPLPGRMWLVSPEGSHKHPIALLEISGAVGTWWLLACFNTLDTPHVVELKLDQLVPITGHAHVFNVWQEHYERHDISKTFSFEVKGHQVALFALRQLDQGPAWIGDKVHLSQGLIVDAWQARVTSLELSINSQRICKPRAWIYLPGEVQSVSIDKVQVQPRTQDGLLLLQLESMREGNLEIHWTATNHDH